MRLQSDVLTDVSDQGSEEVVLKMRPRPISRSNPFVQVFEPSKTQPAWRSAGRAALLFVKHTTAFHTTKFQCRPTKNMLAHTSPGFCSFFPKFWDTNDPKHGRARVMAMVSDLLRLGVKKGHLPAALFRDVRLFSVLLVLGLKFDPQRLFHILVIVCYN